MLDRIERAVQLARQAGDYHAFREAVYAQRERYFCRITCDSRETIPLTLALFWLAEGKLERCVTYAANLGRDADTIGTMCGAIAGALGGVEGIRSDWVDKAQNVSSTDQQELAGKLASVAIAKHKQETEAQSRFEHLLH
jgi:ADP-ribosylglycohydrolase